MNATIQNDINGQLQIIGAQSIQDRIDYAYEAMREDSLCRMVADYTMDDVGCEFDPKLDR